MSGKEIRAWAKKEAEGKRWFFIWNHLLVLIPGILYFALSLAAKRNEWTLPAFARWPFNLASQILSLCFLCLVVTLVETGDRGKLLDPFRRGEGKDLLLVAVFLWVVPMVLSILPNLMVQKGQAMMDVSPYDALTSFIKDEALETYRRGQRLKNVGSLLGSGVSLLLISVLFPVRYLLFLKPKRSAGQVIRAGTELGAGSLLTILAFQIRLCLPFIGWLFVIAAFRFILMKVMFYVPPLWIMGSLILCMTVIGLMAWYFPYISLAQARFAKELIVDTMEETAAVDGMEQFTKGLLGTPPPFRLMSRTMRLCRKDGWYYRDHKKGPVRKGPLERK